MEKATTLSILKRARQLVNQGWVRSYQVVAKDGSFVSSNWLTKKKLENLPVEPEYNFCLLGAVNYAAHEHGLSATECMSVKAKLTQTIAPKSRGGIAYYNDIIAKNKHDITNVIDDTIERIEKA